jgi:hypothetical protein
MGPVAVYLPLGEYLQQQATGSLRSAHYALLAAVYGTAAVIAVCSVVRTRPLQWRAVAGLLAVSLLLVTSLAVQRLAEMHANGGFPYRLHLIAAWVTASIALSATAWTALIVDSLRARRHDWLTIVALVAMTLNASSVGIAFWPVLARMWRDFYSFILATFAGY